MPQPRNIIVSVITQTVVAVVLLGFAATIVTVLVKTKPVPQATDVPNRPRRVAVMKALAVPVHRQWQGFGTAAAMDSADVPAQVSAIVTHVPANVVQGAEVAKDGILAQLDESDFVQQRQIIAQRISEIQAQLAQLALEERSLEDRVQFAQKETELVQRDFQRAIEAFQRNGATQREVDRVEQDLKVRQRLERLAEEEFAKIGPRRERFEAQRLGLESEANVADLNVQRCTIRSPLDGFIQDVDVEQGERVSPGQRVARVVSLRRIEVPLQLPSSARPNLAIGDQVLISARSASSQHWQGEVRRIAPEDDSSTRTMTVYVEVEQDPHDPALLPPGKFVQGTVIAGRVELRYIVPRRALVGDRLLTIEDNVVRSIEVRVDFHVQGEFPQLGVVAEQWAVLAEPLPDGTLVVVNAARSLPDGIEVEPVPLGGPRVRATAQLPGAEGVP